MSDMGAVLYMVPVFDKVPVSGKVSKSGKAPVFGMVPESDKDSEFVLTKKKHYI